VAAAITELRQSIKASITTEFAAEGLIVLDDKLHDAMGTEKNIAAVFPEGERMDSSGIVSRFVVSAQVFMRWDPQIDPAQIVDPGIIEGWAWRLQRRMLADSNVNGANVSYYIVSEVLYPDDPTGNKTRFVLTAVGFGHNPSAAETQA
jgi:hypothetical protein